MATLLVLLVSLRAVLYVQSAEVQHLMTGVNYLQKYGYMEEPDPNAAELITEIEVRQSIVMMQRFFGLPQTGQIDERTAYMMQKPRCGLPDISPRGSRWYGSRRTGGRRRRYLTQDVRWDKYALTYSFDNYTPDMTQAEARDSIERALKTWSDVTPLTFRETQGGNPDIHIQFTRRSHGDSYAFDGPGGTLAHAFFPGDDIGGDAHFDDDELYTYSTYEGTNLFTVAAHEFGHALGLGHSDVPGALMAPYYQGYDPNFALPYDDIAGIQSLYGSNPRPPPRPQPRPTSRPVQPEIPEEEPEPSPSLTCLGHFSAVADIRRQLFIFKGDQMWRLSTAGIPLSGYPMQTSRFWQSAPSDADAVFEKLDGTIVFVKDFKYWEFDGLNLKQGFPKFVFDFTERELSEVDAVISLRRQAKTYFFKGALCWRFDGMRERMDAGYPKLITDEWFGGPDKVDAAFTFDYNSYLVQGNRYWRFSDGNMAADSEARWLTVDFLGCSEDTVVTDAYDEDTVVTDDEDTVEGGQGGTDKLPGGSASAARTISGIRICVLSALVALLLFR